MSLQPYEPPLPVRSNQPMNLMQWAEEASDVHKIAQMLATTQFVPRALQGRPDEIAAQILYGREVNLPPMVALAQINIIDGRPSLSALSMRGLAQAGGVKFRLDESTETRCKYSAMAPGDTGWTTITWTMDRAKKLGLTNKKNWTAQPQAMLIARATAELCRLVAAPLFLGMAYASEELRDGVDVLADVHVEPPAEPEPEVRTIKRAPVKAKASVPQTRPAEQPAAESEPVTVRTDSYSTQDVAARPLGVEVERNLMAPEVRASLTKAFNAAGIKDRMTRQAYVSDILGREVNTFNQVSTEEGNKVLEQLVIDHPVVARDWEDVDVVKVPADE